MLEILISSSVLILVLAILRLVLRGKISARLQYALWLLVLVRLLLPVSFFHSPVSVAEAAAPVTERMEDFSERTHVYAITNYVFPADGVQTIPSDQRQVPTVREAARYVWYAGTAVMAGWFLFVNIRLARRLRKGRTPYRCASVLPVYVAEGLPSPCLFGLVKPSVYLTPRAAEDEAEARQILTHELTHYRHGDAIWALLRSICLAVWWFNPLVWLAAALSRQDAELACDEGTIRALGEAARFDYGRTLVGMAKVGATPSDLLCGATTMTTGKKSLKERVARIASAPKMSGTVAAIVLLIAAVAVGCTFSGAAKDGPEVSPEIALDTASATDSEEMPKAYNISIHDSETGEIRMIEPAFSGEFQDLYALYTDLKALAHPMEVSDVFSDDVNSYSVCFYKSEDAGFTSSNFVAGFDVWEDGMFLLYGGNSSTPPGVYQSKMFAEDFLDILDEYHSESAQAVTVSDEPIGTYDRAYWEEVDRELASFANPADIRVSVADGFDEAIPEGSLFGPMTLADYIYGTDGWKFEYNSEMPGLEADAQIIVYDPDGRALWIEADMNALMLHEADGSITRVTYQSAPVDCTDMIRHLLPWARGEYTGPGATAVLIQLEGQDTSQVTGLVGSVIDLDEMVFPYDAEFQTEWISSDETVATVDGEGRVTFRSPGYCTVTVWVDKVSADCEIYVESSGGSGSSRSQGQSAGGNSSSQSNNAARTNDTDVPAATPPAGETGSVVVRDMRDVYMNSDDTPYADMPSTVPDSPPPQTSSATDGE